MSDAGLIFYHSPKTRSSCVLALLEELDAPYTLCDLNFRIGAQRRPEYLAINPMGKVPAIVHDGVLVTELPAIFIYLADAFPQKNLAPAIGDPLRGSYLRWLVFYGAAFEPAALDRLTRREPLSRGMNPYGDFDTTLKTIETQLASGPYILGARFTAADLLWGIALRMMISFGALPATPVLSDYAARTCARPSIVRVDETDRQLLTIHEAMAARG
jgi:glutathione S-transferase